MDHYDLVIVGGGVAGLCAALSAPEGARIAVVDKGEAGAGSSPLAQGGLAAAVGAEDSVDLHVADTLAAGAGIADEAAVRDVCGEGPDAVAWLVKLGCAFDRDASGELDRAREGGQSVARSVHWRDSTGAEIVRALRAAARGRAERILERATALAVVEGSCAGVHTEAGPVLGRATLLASGGAGALWAATTNAPGATGDGIAMALAAGVRLADLELMQFHPTALDDGRPQRVLVTEALRGAGAILVDAKGERFVDELAPRHVVTAAILERGRVFLDCRTVPELEERFPTVVAGARSRGFDPVSSALPVSPAAHYFIGGVAADTEGRTSMPGLWAAGECASTGMHGANRMAGNSLLEAVVVGRRVGSIELGELPVDTGAPEAMLGHLSSKVPGIMWERCGPRRDAAGLTAGLDELGAVEPSGHRALCEAIVTAALQRTETRGVHLRADAPSQDPSLARRLFL
jgi:L-aspartate oxidase